MHKMENMKALVDELVKASNAYYNSGKPIMSDQEFDIKLARLKQLELETHIVLSDSPTKNVGASVLDTLKKVTHEHKPMLSLEKVHTVEEIIKFANGQPLVAMIKLDGLSVRLTYEDGELVRGETRGNGIEGSDITEHVKQFVGVPLKIKKNGLYVVDGEAIITDHDFEMINAALPEGAEPYKNSRNLASGTLALLDTSVVKERKLRFILWDVIIGCQSKLFTSNIIEAGDLGFDTTPILSPNTNSKSSIEEINQSISDMCKVLGYPMDGVVWKFDDIVYGENQGQTSHHFCNAVAFKFKDEVYETTLRKIDFTMGKTGILTPTAVFDPVDIDGTTVTRASVHNISILTKLDLRPGDTITVYKANMIIPQIAENLSASKGRKTGYMTYPTVCPVCGGITKLQKDNDTIVMICTNEECKGKLLGKLSHAVSKNALNIDGLSEVTLEKFIELGWVSRIEDIYNLKLHEDEMKKLEGFGTASVKNILAAIEKSRSTTLERFLYAQSIPLIGRSASKDIAKACNEDIEKFCQIASGGDSIKKFLSIDGFGAAMVNSLTLWIEKHWIEFLSLKSNVYFICENIAVTNGNLGGKTFCITGKLEHFANRDALISDIEVHGGKYVSSVSAKTNYLINNDIMSTSGKNAKAKQVGCQIISELDYMEMIK